MSHKVFPLQLISHFCNYEIVVKLMRMIHSQIYAPRSQSPLCVQDLILRPLRFQISARERILDCVVTVTDALFTKTCIEGFTDSQRHHFFRYRTT